MGKVDLHVPGYEKFPEELKLHIADSELDTDKCNTTWLNIMHTCYHPVRVPGAQ